MVHNSAVYRYEPSFIEIMTASIQTENHASAHTIEKTGFIRTASGVPEDWGREQLALVDKWFL